MRQFNTWHFAFLMDIGWMDDLPLFDIWWIVWHVWWTFGFRIWINTNSLSALLLGVFWLQVFHIQVLDVVQHFFLSAGFDSFFMCQYVRDS
jgi:hypothetical protein